MQAREILEKLRHGQSLSEAEIYWFAEELAQGGVSDAQAGAFAMAICQTGLSQEARVQLTHAMRESGETLHWSFDGPVLDKHSTGGVGDCTSLILAPALAACGAYVPMISGRGLGHTGGTLDKLEAIPGYRTQISVDDLQDIVGDIGCAIVGATGDIAPADRRLYAVRDVTGTVGSLDLIVASILSKKLACGPEALVLDVKTGTGAVLKDDTAARELADALVKTAQASGTMTTALISDMNQPLANAAGNALEVIEAMHVLTGAASGSALHRLCLELGGEVLALGGIAADAKDGAGRIAAAIRTGEAAEIFGRMIARLGGPRDFVEHWRDRLPAAQIQRDLFPTGAGYVAWIDTRALGDAVVALGGGRVQDKDRIDARVGLSGLARLGDYVDADRPLMTIHAAREEDADRVTSALISAFRLRERPEPAGPLIRERIAQ
ncbi:MAG: thymidine phosphorylase [Pseudomonadota bacterium]